ncbi:hypothetical protein PE067_11815 [Paracoccus sp. DMF-8]|uniref:hypothetical protein n=1 Tax=Paracoccus sp. DMF-8 TaxID=3019445 RepID=UPI0023E75C8E|nr:hypothetical protein [Paracoccus sp. DMF-8]MDF3606753.1 hypothetical protein [Paracoccus sp. DMF-8]
MVVDLTETIGWQGRSTKLLGTLFISAATASAAAVGLTALLDISLLMGLLVYSVVGAATMILLSWRRFLLSEREEENGHWVGANAHRGYVSLSVERRQ